MAIRVYFSLLILLAACGNEVEDSEVVQIPDSDLAWVVAAPVLPVCGTHELEATGLTSYQRETTLSGYRPIQDLNLLSNSLILLGSRNERASLEVKKAS